MIRAGAIFALAAMLAACSQDAVADKAAAPSDSTAAQIPTVTDYDNRLGVYGDKPGVSGIFDVKPMLCLAKMDSAPMRNVGQRVSACYELLDRELLRTGAQYEGPAGQVTFSNDTGNFRFRCFVLIKQMPGRQPDSSTVSMLKAGKMLVYNHYGPYADLYKSYDSIRTYLGRNSLTQSGPMREYYVTDPQEVKERERWLTKIMVPVSTQ